jgi:hypothetical protein
VTSLLSAGLPKPALVGWAAKVTAEYAIDNAEWIAASVREGKRDEVLETTKKARFRKSQEASVRGTEVHAAAEALNLGTEPQVDESILPYVEQYRRFLHDHTPTFEAAEAPVYNLTWHYAGTLDAIAIIDGRRCVLDVKTTDRPPGKGARPPYPEVALQLCAYSRAEGVGVNPERVQVSHGRRYYVLNDPSELEPMPEIEGAFALVVSPYDYQLVPVAIGEDVWTMFLHVREVARWAGEVSRTVLGPPATPRAA